MNVSRILILPLLLYCGILLAGETPNLLLPDFSGKKLPKEIKVNNPRWQCVNGVLRSPDHSRGGMSGFSIERENPGDYELQFRLRKLAQHPKDQHFGFSPRKGVTIYCRGNILVLRIPERKVHTGFGKKFKTALPVGKDAQWSDFLISVKGDSLSVRLNNETIAEVDDLPRESGKFTFYTYGCQLELADFSMKIFRKGENVPAPASPNAVLNASFEQCTLDNLPDYWGVPAWGLVEPEVIVRYKDEWLKRYGADSSTAFHGSRSLRIVNTEPGKAKLSYTLWSCYLQEKKNVPYTLSAYLKSDPPGMKVAMRGFGIRNGPGREKTVELSGDWKRYTFTFTPRDTGNGPLMFIPYSKGTFWIDAVQLEQGDKATPFQPAGADRKLVTHEGNPDKPLYDVPVIPANLMKEVPKLDGLLQEPVWQRIQPVFLKTPFGKEPQEKTAFRIFYTAEGIWIGIDAEEKDSDRIRCRKTKRDEYVWGDPSFELFLDSKLTRATYHHLAFNADGVQYDDYLGNAVWNGQWQVRTARKPDRSGWTAELFLPFSDMNIDHANTDRWGFNLCRNNPRKGEISCWAPTYGGFHAPLRFGQLIIRSDIQKCFYAGIRNPLLRYAGSGKCELSATLFNHTGASLDMDAIVTVHSEKNGKPLSFRKHRTLPDRQEQRVILGSFSGTTEDSFAVETVLSGNGRKLSSSREQLRVDHLLSILTQYNYCTTEKTMLLRGRFGVSADLAEHAALKLEIQNPEGKTVYTARPSIRNGKFEISLPVGEWKEDSYTAVCRLLEGERTAVSAKSTFRKLPPSETEVRIDRFRRITLVNGKPYFPLGFFWEGRLTPELVAFLAKEGINFIHSYTLIPEEVLEAGKQHGVMFEMQILDGKKKGINQEALRNYKKHPALLCWYTYDEAFAGAAGQKNPEKILRDIELVRRLDPYRPAVLLENQYGMSYLAQKGLAFPGDIPTLDYYAWPPEGNIQLWDNYSKELMRMGELDGRPAWAVPFVSGYGYHTSRDILPEEQVYQSYICIINGCRGIAYWASFPKAPSSFRTICRLFREFTFLKETLISLEETPLIPCTSAEIRYTVRKWKGDLYIISVNEAKRPVSARFRLSGLSGAETAEVLFENRSVTLRNGVLEDVYPKYARHVYRIRCSSGK